MFEKFVHQTPFFRLVLPLIIGIIFQINFSIFSHYIYYILSVSLVTIIILSVFRLTSNFKLNKLWGVFIFVFLFATGMQLVQIKQQKEYYFDNEKQTFLATAIEQPEEKENTVKAILKVDYIKDSINWIESNTKIICYVQKDSAALNLKLGDQILTNSYINKIKHSGNPYAFNYKNYLKYKEIYNQCYIKINHYKIVDKNRGPKLKLLSNSVRESLLSIYLNNNINGDEFAVLSALTLGFKNELTPELKESFSASGAMHILAVSGLHVGIIFIILGKILFFLERNKYGKIIQSVLIIIVLFFYAFITGLSDSVLRATIMFSFISIGKMFTRQVNIYNSISASAFILLLINPYSIMNVGFQLSYAAVISIVFFQPKIYSLLNFKRTIPDYIWQLISVAIAAQLGTFPITIHYFDQFPLYFILSNILIIPVATIIIYGAIILFAFSFSGVITKYLALALKYTTLFLNQNVGFIENLPYSKLDQILIDKYEVIILLALILLASFFIISKRLKFLYYSLIVSSGLIIYNISLGYVKSQKSLFTVHNISSTSVIHFVDKQKSAISYNDTFNLASSNINYNIYPLWKELEVDITDIKVLYPENDINYYEFNNKRIIQLTGNSFLKMEAGNKITTDYLILSNNTKLNINTLNQYFDFKKIIFDSSNSFYTIKNWKEQCIENNIDYFNVLENGAYIEYL